LAIGEEFKQSLQMTTISCYKPNTKALHLVKFDKTIFKDLQKNLPVVMATIVLQGIKYFNEI
jgi:hypothetical protein